MPDRRNDDSRESDSAGEHPPRAADRTRRAPPDPDRFMRRSGESWDAYKTAGVVRSAAAWRRKWARVMAPRGAARALVAAVVGVSVIAGTMWIRVARRTTARYSAVLVAFGEVQRSVWRVIEIAPARAGRDAGGETAVARIRTKDSAPVVLEFRCDAAAGEPPAERLVMRDDSGEVVWQELLPGAATTDLALFVRIEPKSFPPGVYVCAVERADGTAVAQYRFETAANRAR